MKNKRLVAYALWVAGLMTGAWPAVAAPAVLVCTNPDLSAPLQQAVKELLAKPESVPLLAALRAAGESGAVQAQDSAALLAPAAFDRAAHNHLIVIGLPSKDPLMSKVWGMNVSVDEAAKQFDSLGWGRLQGDIGWIESDRNPFLHSQKITSIDQDTILVKIGGTSEAGVLAALKAFENGQLGGFVPAGPVTRPETTLLDRDPDPRPVGVLPPTLALEAGKTATFAGWYDLPESEYRAVEEASGIAPVRMRRSKYLVPGIFEQPPAQRWLGGVHRMAFGNAVNVIEFTSEADAARAVRKMAEKDGFKRTGAVPLLWSAPQSTDQVLNKPFWEIQLAQVGPYVLMATLPRETMPTVAKALVP